MWKNGAPISHYDLQRRSGMEIPLITYYRLIHAAALRLELDKHKQPDIRHEYWRVRGVLESLEEHEEKLNGNQTR